VIVKTTVAYKGNRLVWRDEIGRGFV
jgi:hypothetical protein